ncbi:MAG: ATP-binding protein [Thermoanaerobaculia bacterium]
MRSGIPAAALALLLTVAPALATPSHLPEKIYDLTSGVAGDSVWDLKLDRLGALWIATTGGISRYDGVHFQNFDSRHGLPNANVTRMLILADGRLLASSAAGPAILDPVRSTGVAPWVALRTDTQVDVGQLNVLAVDDAEAIWLGGQAGLFELEGVSGSEHLVARSLPEGEHTVRLVSADGERGLWVELAGGLYHRGAEGSWRGPWELPGVLDDAAGANDLLLDADGVLWISSRQALCGVRPPRPLPPAGERLAEESGLADLADLRAPAAPGAAVCVDVAHGLPRSVSQRRFDRNADGRLFCTGASGVVEIAGDRLLPLQLGSSARDLTLRVTLATPDGSLWFGTAERGLMRQIHSGIELRDGTDLLPSTLSTLLVDGAEPLVVIGMLSPERRLLRLRADGLADVTPRGASALEASWGWGAISALAPDGAWWVGHTGGVAAFARHDDGTYDATASRWRELDDRLAGREPIRLHFLRSGALLVATTKPSGLVLADPRARTVRDFPEFAEFPGSAPTALAEAPDGTLWAGFYNGGLARGTREGGFRWVEGASAVHGFVHELAFTSDGALWVASGGGPVVCRSPGATTPDCERAAPGSALAPLPVYGITEVEGGEVLAATAKGVFLLALDGTVLGNLNAADGIPGNNIRELERAPDGGAWIGSVRGLVRWRPQVAAGRPQPTRIVALSVAGRPVSVPLGGVDSLPPIRLAPGERVVEIEAASVHLEAGAPPSYQWRIGDAEWTAPSGDRRIRLAGLAEGALPILVRAVSSGGEADPVGARLDLQVLAPFWRRGWFLTTVALLLAAALALVYRARVARLLALERVRTSIAADLHDDLGASLSRISILSEVARSQNVDGGAGATLATIGESARELAERASDIVWAIDPQRDDLGSWASRLRRYGDDLFEPLGISFELRVPADAPAVKLVAAVRRDLFLIVKEALNNAAKYSAAAAVRMNVELAGRRLRLVIEDDGCGVAADAVARAVERGGGRGLQAMALRAERLGATFERTDRAAGGTRIELALVL